MSSSFLSVSSVIRIAHIGIAVNNLDDALRFYHETLDLPLHGREEVGSERVRVAFLPIGDTEIELLEATDPDSPIARFIQKHGEGVHHLAFAVADLDAALAAVRQHGFLIDEQPRTGAGGTRVAFLHPKSTNGVLIELCEQRVQHARRQEQRDV